MYVTAWLGQVCSCYHCTSPITLHVFYILICCLAPFACFCAVGCCGAMHHHQDSTTNTSHGGPFRTPCVERSWTSGTAMLTLTTWCCCLHFLLLLLLLCIIPAPLLLPRPLESPCPEIEPVDTNPCSDSWIWTWRIVQTRSSQSERTVTERRASRLASRRKHSILSYGRSM